MDNLKRNFIKINKRQPTEAEFAYLVDIVTSMGIDENDEMLLIFIALQKMIADGQLGTAEVVRQNSESIDAFSDQLAKCADAHVAVFQEGIKKLFAQAVDKHETIQANTTQTLINAVRAFKGEHDAFIKRLDEKVDKELTGKVQDLVASASRNAKTRLSWLFIGGTVTIVCSLFFGCFLYATKLAYDKGQEAGRKAVIAQQCNPNQGQARR